MLHEQIIAICSTIHTKETKTLYGHGVQFYIDKPDGTRSNQYVLKG
jgi:hypothetical protein